jgi:Domain of unknown function (DUF397)
MAEAGRSANNGACVEVAPARGQIFVRDSKDQDGPIMRYSAASWQVFLNDVKSDQFDLTIVSSAVAPRLPAFRRPGCAVSSAVCVSEGPSTRAVADLVTGRVFAGRLAAPYSDLSAIESQI